MRGLPLQFIYQCGVALGLVLVALPAPAQTNLASVPACAGELTCATNGAAHEASERRRAQRAEQIRTACLQGERHICGRVLQVLPKGLVVESGFTNLLDPHFRQLWRVPGTADIPRHLAPVELDAPGAPCVGLVYLTDLPKRPAVKLYDYVTIRAYPAGEHAYVPITGVAKSIRQFAVRLSTAVRLNLEAASP
jgi:hypothetical protein